ncbi:MAG: hypothetical protein WEF86_14735 [Gemmatimonadota bacterium]
MQDGLQVTHPVTAARVTQDALLVLDAAGAASLDDVAVSAVLAWLAGGRFERVRRILLQAQPAPALPLVAARYVSWTGDLTTAAAAWQSVHAATGQLIENASAAVDPERAWLRATTFVELQRTAADLGDPMLAALLHRHARGGPRPGSAAPFTGADPLAEAAAAVLQIVHATLGIEPDATRHRLRLAPRMPVEPQRFAARGIRFGDGSVAFDAQSEQTEKGGCYTFRVGQDSGAIPLTVLLEPLVRGTLTAACVDGKAAELTPRAVDRGTIVPVQLVLDEERTLTLMTEPVEDDEGRPRG